MGGDLAVHGHGVFHHHEGPSGADVVEKYLVEPDALLLQHVLHHLYPPRPQELQPLARHQGVGVAGAHHHPADARGQDGVGAGGLAPVVAAGLQGDVQLGPPGVLRAGGQGAALGVGLAAPLVPALAQDPAVPDDHRAHHGVGGGPARAPLGQLQGQAHVVPVVQPHHLKPYKKCPERDRSGHGEGWTRRPRPRQTKSSGTSPFQSRAAGAGKESPSVVRSSFYPDYTVGLGVSPSLPFGPRAVPPVGNHTPP